MRMSRTLLCAVSMSVAALSAHADQAPEFDLTKKVWVDGKAVDVFVLGPSFAGGHGPDQDDPKTPDVKVWLVGAISEANPFGPEKKMPAMDPATGKPLLDPQGKPMGEIVIPAHDDTFARFIPKEAKADTFGYWVIAGPKATPETVRLRKSPPNSLSGADLAHEIKLDGKWQALTDVKTIERGLKEGLIAEKFSNWGGVAWLGGAATASK